MNRTLSFTLLGDGTSDRALLPALAWCVRRHAPELEVHHSWADLARVAQRPRGLAERLRHAIDLYPCDLLFVHRDAEREPREKRWREIEAAFRDSGRDHAWIGVIPVRMTEAWLLVDEHAIRAASGNPNGDTDLALPPLDRIESLPDPKLVLRQTLQQASGLGSHRLRRFDLSAAVFRVANLMDSFTPLLQLDAFSAVDDAIARYLARRRGPSSVDGRE